MDNNHDNSKYLLSTLVKAKDVLTLLQAKTSVTLHEVMTALNLSKTTAFRLLYSLTELDFLIKHKNRYYLKNYFFATKLDQRINWSAVPILKPLVYKYQLSAYIGIIFQNEIVITQVIPAKQHLDDLDRLGESLPLNTSAMGKCALAFLPPKLQDQMLYLNDFPQKTKHTLTDTTSLKHNLKVILAQGYALDDEEKELNFRCVSVPIMESGKSVAVLGLSGSLDALKRCDIKHLAKDMRQKSNEIEQTLLH